MEINGNIEIKGFTRIYDLEDGTTFAFCDDSELFLKGSNCQGYTFIIRLEDGTVYDIDDECWGKTCKTNKNSINNLLKEPKGSFLLLWHFNTLKCLMGRSGALRPKFSIIP